MSEAGDVLIALTDYDAASAKSRMLETPALRLVEELDWREAVEVFRRVAAREITAGGFLTRFGEAVATADLENQVLLLPTIYKLLAKYPALVEQHRAKAPLTGFPLKSEERSYEDGHRYAGSYAEGHTGRGREGEADRSRRAS